MSYIPSLGEKEVENRTPLLSKHLCLVHIFHQILNPGNYVWRFLFYFILFLFTNVS